MKTEVVDYLHGSQALKGYLAYNDTDSSSRPAVMVAHDWSGRNQFACDKAEALAKLGYIAFAIDMYGDGRTGETTEEKMALMEPVVMDRELLRERITCAYNYLAGIKEVDTKKIAAIGFCFGGLCVLDLARTGIDIAGVVSFHGLLDSADNLPTQAIKAKALVLHGYDDPMVPPEKVQTFCDEMTMAGADWQMHLYGNTLHAFTNPQANDQAMGTVYSELAATRAWDAMKRFFNELFDEA